MAKKTVSKSKAKKSTAKKTTVKKTAKVEEQKAVKPLRKKLGKGLEDISTLFLSTVSKPSAPAKKKTAAKKTVVKKTAAKKETEPKKKVTQKSPKAVVEEKPVEKAVKKKIVKKKSTPEKTTVSAVKKAVKKAEKKAAVKKPAKTGQKKAEVVRMDEIKKSSKINKKPAKETQAKSAEKSNGSQDALSRKNKNLGPISELKTLFGKKTGKKEKAAQEIVPTEQIIEDSKFYVSQSQVTRVREDDFYELPAGYGDNRIVIQVRDPYWVFAYWEISQRKLNSVNQKYGHSLNNCRRILRVYDITGVSFNGNNANSFYDIDINDFASNWYINVGNPGRSYCVDIGFLLADGRFVLLARSNYITTPIDGPSHITDEEWMIVEDDFNKLYGLSAGLGIGLSSAELRKKIKSRMLNLSSGILSSPGVTTVTPNRNFWLVVNTELIVYGATQPGAEVTIQGKPIKLNEDGTFSLRFALPNGEQVIPVKAVSPDKLEEREITPIVKRRTV